MIIEPQNRHLLVEVLQAEQKDTPTILVPDDYAARSMDEHQLVRILAIAPDTSLKKGFLEPGQCAVVEGYLIKNVNVKGHGSIALVAENAVLALVEDAAA